MQSFNILLYTTNEYQKFDCADETCEAICRQICKNLGMTPAVVLLFSLRIADTSNFLPNCRTASTQIKYEFRLRFQVPSLSALKQLDKIAYNYCYHQLKCDLIDGKIPELEYPNHKDKVVGLCLTSMYIEMLEFNVTVDELVKNYKNYIPRKYVKKHSFVIKNKIAKELRNISNKKHDSYYVKGTYLEEINRKAPNYLVENYPCIVPYLVEDHLQKGTCLVEIEFSPFHQERPGLSIYYSYKELWKHIAKVDDIYAIIVEKNEKVIFEMRDNPAAFAIQMSDVQQLESFISCVSGYYRLMVKWTINLYSGLASPSLDFLKSIKCHGPIGGEFAYIKLEEKQNIPGSYLIRQCEKEFDIYYIDIITKSIQPETFQITYKHNMWHLHTTDDIIQAFDSLLDLANSIVTESKTKFRLAPSDYDKSPLLLLCFPPKQLTAQQDLTKHHTIKLRNERPQIFNPVKDFGKHINSQKLTENGIITQMQADWILPNDKKLEVTLKILNSEKHLLEFMRSIDKWSCLYSMELIKIYGFTLSTPHTLVIESIKLGPLDVFLRTCKQTISVLGLIDAAFSLAKALHYLEENKIIHGKIRCSSIQVVDYHEPNSLNVRLGIPGFQMPFTKDDIPWIPVEYDDCQLDEAKLDFKAEIWAYSTTLWEIFSRGKQPSAKLFTSSKRILPNPNPQECPFDIYEIMREGWNSVPERRFSPQNIIEKLFTSKNTYTHSYSTVCRPTTETSSTSSSNESAVSILTENTTHSHVSYTSNDLKRTSPASSYGNDDHIPLYTISNGSICSSMMQIDENNGIDPLSVVELDDGKRIIFQGKIGNGHYGTVYRGEYQKMEMNGKMDMQEVAIKTFRAKHDKNSYQDFYREIQIMQNLQHPNIVKIIAWIDHPQISIIMEYVKHRSFLMYLSSRGPSLNTQRLLKFAKDIASGMEYLVRKNIIHRDLAARNILVDSDDCVKISDFGLAQKADSNGYYMICNTREIPIKWYAPEAIKNNKYSFQSDVWSYGVTLFEMFSHGKEPNLQEGVELKPEEILELLENGHRLKRPLLCPESIYNNLMMACWHKQPRERPNFTKLSIKINNFLAGCDEVI